MLTLYDTAMPLGLNTVFSAAYDGDTTSGASMALISYVLSINNSCNVCNIYIKGGIAYEISFGYRFWWRSL